MNATFDITRPLDEGEATEAVAASCRGCGVEGRVDTYVPLDEGEATLPVDEGDATEAVVSPRGGCGVANRVGTYVARYSERWEL